MEETSIPPALLITSLEVTRAPQYGAPTSRHQTATSTDCEKGYEQSEHIESLNNGSLFSSNARHTLEVPHHCPKQSIGKAAERVTPVGYFVASTCHNACSDAESR